MLALLAIALALTARAHACGPAALLAALVAYVLVHAGVLRDLEGVEARLRLLGSPWRLSLFALIAVLLGHAGRRLAPGLPRLVEGPFAQQLFRQRSSAWILAPACALAVLAAVSHTVVDSYRVDSVQVAAPYLGALALALAAWSWRRPLPAYVGAAVLTLGNIHAVRTFAGDLLRGRGLSEIHLACLGFALTAVQAWLLRIAARKRAAAVVVSRVGVAAAGGVLFLLAANYAVRPDLASFSWPRLVASGAMAYLAGLHFRFCAHRNEPGGEAASRWWYGLYHLGVTVAIWCAALLIPWLRSPQAALWALGLPVLYFYLRAEVGTRMASPAAARNRTSAAVLGFAILALYASRSLFQMVLFPDEPIRTDHYHDNSFLVILLSAALLRLNGLGGTPWLAFYGGLGLIAGSFFALTMLPGLSPFERPIPGAWCAIGLGHFWTLVSSRRSPLRTAIQAMAGIDEQTWRGLRRSWGLCLLVAAHAAILWGLIDYRSDTFMMAPLLAGAASISIHHGVLRRSPAFLVLGAIEALAALHADFVVESYLAADAVVWVLLALWAAGLAADWLLAARLGPRPVGWAALTLAAVTFGHVLHHHPGSPVGLWAVALGGGLAALTPRAHRAAESGGELAAGGGLLAIPAWLAYFSQARLYRLHVAGATRAEGLEAALEAWPVLAAIGAAFVTGGLARIFHSHVSESYAAIERPRPRLFDQTLAWLGSSGATLNTVTLSVTLAGAAAVQALHYDEALERGVFTALLLLHTGSALGWHFEGRLRRAMAPYVLLQLSVLALFAVVRRQLMLTTDFWNHEYDVWTSLVVSAGLAGAKQFIDAGPRQARLPLLGTLFALPAITMVWVVVHGLGTDVALVVVGLHSVLFAFLGRDDRESPYAIISVIGFVAFVLLAFWTKLELRFVHAYVIPVGLGVLVLLQLLRDRIDAAVRNGVRLVTLLAMLGSAGYYALLDSRYPIAFILTFGALCLAAMGLGGFLRVRLYLLIGFCGLLVDLAATLYQVLVRVPRGPRMTVIGSLVLAVGAALVFGAIFYKTHRQAVDGRLADWRRRLGSWE
jgi:hypothetical protein